MKNMNAAEDVFGLGFFARNIKQDEEKWYQFMESFCT